MVSSSQSSFAPSTWQRGVLLLLLLAVVVFVIVKYTGKETRQDQPKPFPVKAAKADLENIPMYFQALGTVTPVNTVTVRSRVDGQLMALHFTEGQTVQEGDLLAEIDPRPFEVQLKQAQGALARDTAQLKDARLDLARFRKLIKEQSVSPQQLQAQEALVGQYEGTVLVDQASIADAQLQLTYCRVTAPVAGRLGLKQVDTGNIIHASDSSGIVVITQMHPMQVVFTLVEKQLPAALEAMGNGKPLTVEAWGQDNKILLATGTLLTVDNQIDTSTGTVKAKATFDNSDNKLFPNQFVNIRLLVKTLADVLVVPTSAVQRNKDGFFVYVIEDGKVRMQTITTGYVTATQTVIESGLVPGNVVVTDGVDRLREGAAVTYKE